MQLSEDEKSAKSQLVDVDAKISDLGGIAGLLESALRRFRVASYLIALIPLYIIGIFGIGISATPGVY